MEKTCLHHTKGQGQHRAATPRHKLTVSLHEQFCQPKLFSQVSYRDWVYKRKEATQGQGHI